MSDTLDFDMMSKPIDDDVVPSEETVPIVFSDDRGKVFEYKGIFFDLIGSAAKYPPRFQLSRTLVHLGAVAIPSGTNFRGALYYGIRNLGNGANEFRRCLAYSLLFERPGIPFTPGHARFVFEQVATFSKFAEITGAKPETWLRRIKRMQKDRDPRIPRLMLNGLVEVCCEAILFPESYAPSPTVSMPWRAAALFGANIRPVK